MAKCWSQLDRALVPLISPARNSTIRQAGLGRLLVASPPVVLGPRRRCCPMVRCLSQVVGGAILIFSPALNSTIRPPALGQAPAASVSPALSIQLRCCQMVRCSSPGMRTLTEPPNSTIQRAEPGRPLAVFLPHTRARQQRCYPTATCSSREESTRRPRNSTMLALALAVSGSPRSTEHH